MVRALMRELRSMREGMEELSEVEAAGGSWSETKGPVIKPSVNREEILIMDPGFPTELRHFKPIVEVGFFI